MPPRNNAQEMKSFFVRENRKVKGISQINK